VAGLTPERHALLAAARAVLAGRAFADDALTGCDPALLAAEAHRHQVAPLLWAALAGTPAEAALPPAVRDDLLLAHHRNGLRNPHLARRLAELAGRLAARGVEAMPLKGLVLAFHAYPAPELRGMGDLDLLVREADFPALAEELERLGYAARLPPLASAELPAYAQTVGQVRFTGPAPPVEVHFRLLNTGPPPPREPAWDDAVRLKLGGTAMPVPSPERCLLHLCLHAQQHGFALLRLFADLAVARRAFAVDGDRFADLAHRHHLGTTAWFALAWSAELLDPSAPPPPAALAPGPLARRLFPCLWRRRRVLALDLPLADPEAELPRAYLLGGAPLAAKARFLVGVALPPRRYLARTTRRRHLARLLRGVGRALFAGSR